MRLPSACSFLVSFVGGSFCASGVTAAPTLDAYVLSAGGKSLFGATGNPFSCATFAPDSGAAMFGKTFQLGLPTDGVVCGVGSGGRTVQASAGSAQAAAAMLGVGFGSSADPRTFTGDAQSRASFGDLGVRAASSYSGASDSATVAGSQAGARQVETMNFGGSSGSGTYRPTFTIEGAVFNVGRAESEIEFNYAVGMGPTTLALRITNTQTSGISLYANGAYQAALPGFSTTGDLANGFTVAGTTTFTFDIPIVFGVAQEMSFSLWAATIPRSNAGLLTASGGDASFLNTAKLTGIQVFDSGGTALDDFTITSGSGTRYGAGGVVSSVPEPSSLLLLGVGLLGLRVFRRRPSDSSADRSRGRPAFAGWHRPSSPNLLLRPVYDAKMLAPAALRCALAVATSLLAFASPPAAASAVSISGDTTGAPTFQRPIEDLSALSIIGTDAPYAAHAFTAAAAGSYGFNTSGTFDTFVLLYDGTFQAAAGLLNALIANDDRTSASFNVSGFDFALSAGHVYTYVITGFDNDEFGRFTTTITAPVVSNVPEPATWMLMVVGFAVLMRQRRAPRSSVEFGATS